MKDDSDLERMKRKLRKLAQKSPRRRAAEATPDTSLKSVERRRNRKKSKHKGNRYENVIAKLFSAWSGLEIKRTPGSGGWGTAAFGVTGDLVCSDRRYPFHHECKKREGWRLEDLVLGVRGKDTRSVKAWWKQCTRECPSGKIPTLIFTRNRMADLIMLRASDYDALPHVGDVPREVMSRFVIRIRKEVVVILSLENFLKHVQPPKRKKK